MNVSLKSILEWTQGEWVNRSQFLQTDNKSDADSWTVERPCSLGNAKSSDIAFFFSRAFEHELGSAKPGILLTGEPFVKPLEASGLSLWKETAVVACKDPYFAMALISEKFAPHLSSGAHIQKRAQTEIHPTALVAPSAELGPGVKIGPYCVIEEKVKIGAGSTLYAYCTLGIGSSLGEQCTLFPNVTVYEGSILGNRVRVHAGSVIGSDGFGYAPIRQNKQVMGHQKIYHLGRVVVGDDTEIGANCTLDRGTFGDTILEKQAKLDNLVHIGHNSRVEEGGVICGGTCLAGNARIGKYAYVGGLTGVGNHVHVGDGASVGALAMVTKDVPAGGTAVGNPQRDYREHFKAHALLSQLLKDRRKKDE